MKYNHVYYRGTWDTVIEMEGLENPMLFMQVTDSHLIEVEPDEEVEVLVAISEQNRDSRMNRNHFINTIEFANIRNVDCTILTGDIIHYATKGNLNFLSQQLERLKSPYLYVLGNHDWEYPEQEHNEMFRRSQYEKFVKLTNGDPAMQSKVIGGINLITVDNSLYQISEEQYAFVEEQLALGLPSLLFMHIPLYIPSLLKDVMNAWNAPIMIAAEGWDPAIAKIWSVEEAYVSTQKFHHLLNENPYHNLMGIFCGHVHFTHADAFGKGSYQYVTQPGYSGGYRMIRLVPKE